MQGRMIISRDRRRATGFRSEDMMSEQVYVRMAVKPVECKAVTQKRQEGRQSSPVRMCGLDFFSLNCVIDNGVIVMIIMPA